MNRTTNGIVSIAWYFFVFGAAIGNWAATLPFIEENHSLDDATFGWILLVLIGGAATALFWGSNFNRLCGSSISLLIGSAVLVFSLPLIGFATTTTYLTFGVFLLGFGCGWTDVAANFQGVLCERTALAPRLGLFHGFYAFGALCGALFGGYCLTFVNFSLELLWTSIILFVPGLYFAFGLFSFEEEAVILISDSVGDSVEEERTPLKSNDANNRFYRQYRETRLAAEGHESDFEEVGFYDSDDDAAVNKLNHERRAAIAPTQRPDYGTVAKLSLLCLLSYIIEGSVQDWSAIYISDNLRGNALQSALGFAAFQAMVALGRIYGDRLVLVIGRQRLLQLSGLLGSLGLLLVAGASFIEGSGAAQAVAIVGFAVCGAGISSVTPSVIAVASLGIQGFLVTDSVAYVSVMGYSGMAIGPPLLGEVSVLAGGLQWSYLAAAGLVLFIPVTSYFLPVREGYYSLETSEQE